MYLLLKLIKIKNYLLHNIQKENPSMINIQRNFVCNFIFVREVFYRKIIKIMQFLYLQFILKRKLLTSIKYCKLAK